MWDFEHAFQDSRILVERACTGVVFVLPGGETPSTGAVFLHLDGDFERTY